MTNDGIAGTNLERATRLLDARSTCPERIDHLCASISGGHGHEYEMQLGQGTLAPPSVRRKDWMKKTNGTRTLLRKYSTRVKTLETQKENSSPKDAESSLSNLTFTWGNLIENTLRGMLAFVARFFSTTWATLFNGHGITPSISVESQSKDQIAKNIFVRPLTYFLAAYVAILGATWLMEWREGSVTMRAENLCSTFGFQFFQYLKDKISNMEYEKAVIALFPLLSFVVVAGFCSKVALRIFGQKTTIWHHINLFSYLFGAYLITFFCVVVLVEFSGIAAAGARLSDSMGWDELYLIGVLSLAVATFFLWRWVVLTALIFSVSKLKAFGVFLLAYIFVAIFIFSINVILQEISSSDCERVADKYVIESEVLSERRAYLSSIQLLREAEKRLVESANDKLVRRSTQVSKELACTDIRGSYSYLQKNVPKCNERVSEGLPYMGGHRIVDLIWCQGFQEAKDVVECKKAVVLTELATLLSETMQLNEARVASIQASYVLMTLRNNKNSEENDLKTKFENREKTNKKKSSESFSNFEMDFRARKGLKLKRVGLDKFLADTLLRAGMRERDLKMFGESETSLAQSLAITKRLVDAGEERSTYLVPQTWLNLSVLYREMGFPQKRVAAAKEAVKRFCSDAASRKKNDALLLALSLKELGIAFIQIKENQAGKEKLLLARKAFLSLEQTDCEAFAADLLEIERELVNVHQVSEGNDLCLARQNVPVNELCSQ